MKVRKGFVSNSSSSSFICDITGASESGIDVSLTDFEMVECVKGHTFCYSGFPEVEEWAASDEDCEDYIEDERNTEYGYGLPERLCPICQKRTDGYEEDSCANQAKHERSGRNGERRRMKTRLSFVSNSSSSSFIVGIKGNTTFDEKSIVDTLNVPEDSALRPFANSLAQFIVRRAKEVTQASMLDNYGCEDFEEALCDEIPEALLLENGFKVYSINCSYNESDNPIELFIGNGGLEDADTDSIAFKTAF